MLTLMTSVGHQTGLFDAMANLPASTSHQIADSAGLNERYVREWLGSMVTGAIVEYDREKKTYRLPPEHGAFLTRAAGPDNMAILSQFVPLMGLIEGKLIDAFRNGGGVPYSEYRDFHRMMAETSAAVHDHKLIDTILPLVPGLTDGLQSGIDVADIGCGSGHAINLMARTYPKSRFTGYDFSEEGIGRARNEAAQMNLPNVRFEQLDVAELRETEAYDLITVFDAIHDQAKPAVVLRNISNAVRKDGIFFMIDVAASSELGNNLEHPLGTFLYSISTAHCMNVSLALDGDGLGAVWGEEMARRMLSYAGFKKVSVQQIENDIFNNYYPATKE
jgi:2-polyprenyl-3-methyl-5-hydroxy-6-metoxy-1,4-benzoquinol methylase